MLTVDEVRDRIADMVEDHEASPQAMYEEAADRIIAAVAELFTDGQIRCVRDRVARIPPEYRGSESVALLALADTLEALRALAAHA